MTCGSPQCKRKWHKKRCAQWNKENTDYFRANYIRRQIERAALAPAAKRRLGEELVKEVQEVIGVQQLIIIEYFGRLLIQRFQDMIKLQRIEIARELSRLPVS